MQSIGDPIGYVPPVGSFVDMLKLAAATLWKMSAHRNRMVWAMFDCPIDQQSVAWRGERGMTAICRDALTSRRDPNDEVRIGHKVAGRR
jgi:hypothetical protein